MRIVVLSLCILALAGSAGCGGEDPSAAAQVADVVRILEPRDGSVFPPGFTPPTFLWEFRPDATDLRYDVTITFADGSTLKRTFASAPPTPGRIDERAIGETNELYVPPNADRLRAWTPDATTWAEIQRRSTGSTATVSIADVEVRISTSPDPLEAPIFYRDVPLMPSLAEESGVIRPLAQDAIGLIEWRLRDVSRPESKIVLTDMPSCANCHSFSRDGKTLAMDVDGPTGDKGAYAIAPIEETTEIGPEQVITWNSYRDKPEGHKTIGFLSRVSPDGRYVLTTLNEALYVANFPNHEFLQVFFPTRGILAYYDTQTGEMKALPGADDTDYVHTNGVWTPDGKAIVFSRAKAFDPYVEGQPLATHPNDPNEPDICYDLHKIPFDAGRGGRPIPVEGASDNGMSNTFPKVSPDGKWIVYTKCMNGQLMRPDGRLWIVPLEGGEAREMRCNTDRMNSWHSFSPDGRWMVFSSKTNTPYTQMFLTHIDEHGNDTPPVLVPNSTASNRAVNLPEFVNIDYDALEKIEVPAVEHHRLYFEGLALVREEQYEQAIPVLERALETEPEFSRAFVTLGLARMELGHLEPATMDFERAVELDPVSSEAHNNLGLAYLRGNRAEAAIPHLRRAITINFFNYRAEHNLALALSRLDRHGEALTHLERAARLAPDDAGVASDLGYVLTRVDRPEDAARELERALDLDPDLERARHNLAKAYLAAGDDAGAAQVFDAILEREPENRDARLMLTWLLATSPDDAVRDGARAVALYDGLERSAIDPAQLDVLAAAYAEVGRFEEAVVNARLARDRAAKGEGVLAPGIERRIAAYEAKRPWRQKARRP